MVYATARCKPEYAHALPSKLEAGMQYSKFEADM